MYYYTIIIYRNLKAKPHCVFWLLPLCKLFPFENNGLLYLHSMLDCADPVLQ